MVRWSGAEDVLNFAIQNEEDAARFYRELAEKMTAPAMRDALLDFAREEDAHKEKLLQVKKMGTLGAADVQIQNLQIGDYMVEIDPAALTEYAQALALAMKQEEAARKLYANLAETTEDESLVELFLALANEEAKHKLRFETEYDEYVLKEN